LDLEERRLRHERRAGATVHSNDGSQGDRPPLSVEAERLNQIIEKISAITKNGGFGR